ncbi:NAD(P)/FAD-dependent oxidoreductase [candidate division KSB1 bacterium]|nr:NAD(P)/FAD-dependent oxidoreductase [candidate division KSB1 bacterium]RQW08927.1 MAG: NAD(P)/FAD-dependent oxidoreductase [candidate division KSB1 bacterium]
MSDNDQKRRDFIKYVLAGISAAALDWSSLPRRAHADTTANPFDAIIIGSGLGGLSCAAAFARQGFKPLVLEQHDRPGGYATTFRRPGFVFDVSLHSTTVGAREGVHNLIPGFPEITDVEFHPHPTLYRAIFPDHDVCVPQRNLDQYINSLIGLFPEEKEGINGLFADMQGLLTDIEKISNAKGNVDMSQFALNFPSLFKCYAKTWGQVVDARIINPKLKAIISAQWGYYGLPPSLLSSYYYALPAIGYLQEGGYYPRGKSQKISDALVQFIQERGGKVMLSTRVEKILTREQTAYGVKTAHGDEFSARVIVANANAHDTFHKIIEKDANLDEYLAGLAKLSVSLASFQVFLGLKEDLISQSGIADSEIMCESSYDLDASYRAAQEANVENGSFGLTLYDNIYKGYSPEGKNTLNIIALQGYDHWEKYKSDYVSGNKVAYRKEKERMANILIQRVEEMFLPGLSKAIEVKEIGTPLTNVRYTSNYRGAIYGWDQTVNNSGPNRLSHQTPVKNLYLAGAWTKPGHGYGGVLSSGLECFAEIMQQW